MRRRWYPRHSGIGKAEERGEEEEKREEKEKTNGSLPEGNADILRLESLDEDGQSELLVRLEEVVAREGIRGGGSLRV